MKEIKIEQFLILLLISLAVSLFISFLYLTFYRSRATGSQIHRSFPLLGVSVTSIFICIQFSLPLSLGLLGALSIVRFRTPVKEPEEIGFIMIVIAASICCATFNLTFLAVLLFTVFIGLLILRSGPRFLRSNTHDGMILITVPASEYQRSREKIMECLESNFPKGKLESIIENDDESVVSYSVVQLEKSVILKIQSDLKAIGESIKSNIYFTKGAEI